LERKNQAMLKFSANLSMLFTEYPLIERFALAKQYGFSAVEIQFPYDLDVMDIQQQLLQHQLKLVLINLPAGDLMNGGNGLTGVPGQEHLFRQAVFEGLHYAQVLNVPTINILAGRQPIDADLLPCLQTLAGNLRLAARECLSVGIMPVIEAINSTDMPRFLLQNIAQLQEMREAVGIAGLKMQYDCYHMAMMGEDVLDGLKHNIDHIGHIQFADCPHRHEPHTGMLDFKAIFDWIAHSTYQGWTGAEYRPSVTTAATLGWMHTDQPL
jgi:hydroxypyruvate isomerase